MQIKKLGLYIISIVFAVVASIFVLSIFIDVAFAKIKSSSPQISSNSV
jgi:hypothetical protein